MMLHQIYCALLSQISTSHGSCTDSQAILQRRYLECLRKSVKECDVNASHDDTVDSLTVDGSSGIGVDDGVPFQTRQRLQSE